MAFSEAGRKDSRTEVPLRARHSPSLPKDSTLAALDLSVLQKAKLLKHRRGASAGFRGATCWPPSRPWKRKRRYKERIFTPCWPLLSITGRSCSRDPNFQRLHSFSIYEVQIQQEVLSQVVGLGTDKTGQLLAGALEFNGRHNPGMHFSFCGRQRCLPSPHARINQHVLVSTCYAPATVTVYRAFRGTDKTPCPRGASTLVGTHGRKHALTPTTAWFLRENCCGFFFGKNLLCWIEKMFKEVQGGVPGGQGAQGGRLKLPSAQHHSPRSQVTPPLAWFPLSFPFP